MILAFTVVATCLPSIATVRVQRKEQDEKQRKWLMLSGAIALITIVGALTDNMILLSLGVLGMIILYCYFLLAPKETI